jgi:hypothetical protein
MRMHTLALASFAALAVTVLLPAGEAVAAHRGYKLTLAAGKRAIEQVERKIAAGTPVDAYAIQDCARARTTGDIICQMVMDDTTDSVVCLVDAVAIPGSPVTVRALDKAQCRSTNSQSWGPITLDVPSVHMQPSATTVGSRVTPG